VGAEAPVAEVPDAAAPDETAASVIVLRFVGAWDPTFRAEVRRELVAQLMRDGMQVRVDPPDAASIGALAHIDLHAAEAQQIAIAVEVRDEVTQKSVRRVVDLSQTAADTQSLVLSIATSELLAASWAELALAAHAHDPPPPVPVTRGLARRGLPPRRAGVRHDLTIAADVQGSLYRIVLLGGGITYGLRPWARVGVEFGLRGLALLPIEAPGGTIGGGVGTVDVALAGVAHAGDRVRLDLRGAVRPGVAWTRGIPVAGAEGARSIDAIVDVTVGPRFGIRTGVVWMIVFADVGWALAGVRLRDTAETVARHSGFIWNAGIGCRFDVGRGRRP